MPKGYTTKNVQACAAGSETDSFEPSDPGGNLSYQLLPNERWFRLALSGVFFFLTCLLCWDLTDPWIGHHDYNGAWISSAARNHIKYGFSKTKLGVVLDNSPNTRVEDFEFYTHHPPLMPILVAGSFAIFGESEWAARFVAIVMTLGTVGLLYAIGLRVASRDIALLTTIFFSFIPMTIYFGRMVNHEVPTLFFSLAAVLAYLRWQGNNSFKDFAALFFLLFMGMLSGWPAYYLGGFLPLHYILSRPRRTYKFKIFLLPMLGIIAFALHLIHIYFLVGSYGYDDLRSVLQLRTSAKTFTWTNLVLREIDRGSDLFTLPLLVLAGLCLFSFFRNRSKKMFSDPLLPVIMMIFGLTHIVLFSHGAWVHDYWAYYCAPPIAMLAAGTTVSFCVGKNKRLILSFVILMVVFSSYGPIRSLHRDDFPSLYDIGLLLEDRVEPEAEILWNLKFAWWPWPQTGYYARRNMYPKRVKTIEKVEEIITQNPLTKKAFIFYDYGQQSAKLKNWLDLFFGCEEFVYSGNHYLIYDLSGSNKKTY